jgi:hypothetical protein
MRKVKNSKQNSSNEILEDALFAVEQQLQSEETKYVKECFEKLIETGKSEKEAKEKIAEALLKEADYVHANKTEFSEERYREYLKEIAK